MPRAEFEEKEFEQAAGLELAEGVAGERGVILSAGQVLERIVGYDAAAAPARRHLIWQLLGVPRPSGLRLIPDLWSPAQQPPPHRLPDTPVSLILQFKRPEYLFGHRATQWPMWHQPFFRFMRTGEQHRILLRLERRLADQALVRYAAPAFWRRSELEAAHLLRQVLSLTGFAKPSDFGRHRVWSYIGPGTHGRGNPAGRLKPFMTFEQLVGQTPARAVSSKELVRVRSFDEHLLFLGEAAAERQPALRSALSTWAVQLRSADLSLTSSTQRLIVALTSIVTLTSRVGASWRVLLRRASDD